MLPRQWTLPTLAALTSLAAACGSTPQPPVQVEPTPTVKEVTPPPPEPEKLCKALDEVCKAEASTKAKIAKSAFVFKPAKGWTYAQGESATIAQAAADGPGVAIAEIEVDPKQEAAGRDTGLAALAKEINVTLPKKKVNWKKADDTKAIGKLKLGLWQIDGGARGDKKGPLLLFAAPVSEGKVLMGVGFVPSDDSSGADAAILESIESITE